MKLIFYSVIFLQAALLKTCVQADKAILREGAAVEKGILTKEGQLLTKEGKLFAPELLITKSEVLIFKNNNKVYSNLKKNLKIAKEFKLTKKKLTEEIIDYGIDFIPGDEIVTPKKENPFLNKVINEIVEGPNGIVLRKVIIYILKDDKFNTENLRTVLNGGKYDTLRFEPETLFGIYFKYSNLFADKTLQEMTLSANCDKGKLEEIKLIADRRKIRKNSVLYNQIGNCR